MPPAEQLSSWLQVFFWLVSSAAGVVGLLLGVKKLREPKPSGLPQPFTVSPHVEYVARPEFEKEIRNAHGRMNRERDEAKALVLAVAAENTALRKKLDDDIAAMGDKLDANNRAGGERETRINGRIDDLRDTVSAMPAQVVSLLRATKGLLE